MHYLKKGEKHIEKEKRSLYELEELFDCELQYLKHQIESGKTTEELMRTFGEVEKRRRRARTLARAKSFRRGLGIMFIIIAVAFTQSLSFGEDLFSWNWFLSFIAELFTSGIIIGLAGLNAYAVTDEHKLSDKFIDHLPNCGTLLFTLGFIYAFSRL